MHGAPIPSEQTFAHQQVSLYQLHHPPPYNTCNPEGISLLTWYHVSVIPAPPNRLGGQGQTAPVAPPSCRQHWVIPFVWCHVSCLGSRRLPTSPAVIPELLRHVHFSYLLFLCLQEVQLEAVWEWDYLQHCFPLWRTPFFLILYACAHVVSFPDHWPYPTFFENTWKDTGMELLIIPASFAYI